ncbi:hypothetical protein HID58_090203, partial [Brassica napus]
MLNLLTTLSKNRQLAPKDRELLNQGKLFACLLLLFGKKTRQVDQVVITVPAVTQDLALVILTVTAPLDVDQILVI